MVCNDMDFSLEITEEMAKKIIREVDSGQSYFMRILDFDYAAVNVERKYNDYNFNEARYFLTLKRHITHSVIK